MTQNEKELLLKDLCGRLPYGVKAVLTQTNCRDSVNKVSEKDLYSFRTGRPLEEDYGQHDYYRVVVTDIKPYLFPLSNMTEEHIFEINDILGKDFEIDKYGITDLIRNRRTCLSYLELDALFEYFNKNHFDYRGLIEKELAIDATNKNIY